MISDARLKEIRTHIDELITHDIPLGRGKEWVRDLLAAYDEQTERIAALEKERTLVRADLIQIKEDCQDFVSDKMLRENVLNLVCAALARVDVENALAHSNSSIKI